MDRYSRYKGGKKPNDNELVNKERYKTRKINNDKDEKTVKNPESIKVDKNVDNEDLFAGLALQRQWDDKPDIDHLSNLLLQLYYRNLNDNNNNNFNDLLDKIFLTALRVKAKTLSFNHFNRSKFKTFINYARKIISKHKNIEFNVPRLERHYLKLCKAHQHQRSCNETYDKLSKIVNKLPNVKQLKNTANELIDKRNVTIENFNGTLEQFNAKLDHINNIYNLLTQEQPT